MNSWSGSFGSPLAAHGHRVIHENVTINCCKRRGSNNVGGLRYALNDDHHHHC